MITVKDINNFLCTIAPIEAKMDFDNIGFLVGRSDSGVQKILVSLDITHDVISEALDSGAELIVSHHPLFFSLSSVTDTDTTGSKIIRLLSGGVSAICMHTNLDAALGGTGDALAAAAGIAAENDLTALLSEDGKLPDGTAYSYGRIGRLISPCSLAEYLEILKKTLNTTGFRYYDAGRDVFHVAVVGGSGGNMLHHAVKRGCDTFLTADIKYDVFLEAKEVGINLIDGDHFCTENLITGVIADKLRAAFPQVEIMTSTCHGQTVRFY